MGRGRLTKYQDIEEWWEMVCSSYLLVSLFAELQINSEKLAPLFRVLELENFCKNIQNGMKELAGKTGVWDLRLISLPFCFNLILPWLKVFPIPHYH